MLRSEVRDRFKCVQIYEHSFAGKRLSKWLCAAHLAVLLKNNALLDIVKSDSIPRASERGLVGWKVYQPIPYVSLGNHKYALIEKNCKNNNQVLCI